MNNLINLSKKALTKTTALGLIAAVLVSFIGLSFADTTHALTVNVTDTCGPVVATVTVVNGPDDGATGTTAANGQFVFASLNEGAFFLHITAAGHNDQDTNPITFTSDQTVNVTLAQTTPTSCGSNTPPPTNPTPATHQLTVNVSDVCGPVVATITVVNGPNDGATGTTGSNGQFVFPSLNEGAFFLHITANNENDQDTGTITLTSDQTVNITMVQTTSNNCGNTPPPPTPATHALTVNVSDTCGPIVATITIVNGPDDGATGTTAANGQFVFPSLNEGAFFLHVTAPNENTQDTGTITLTSDQTVNITMVQTTNNNCGNTPPPTNPTPVTHQLTVNVSDTCGPIVATITIVNGPNDGATGTTGANGQFIFPSLNEGSFFLHVTATNYNSLDSNTINLTSDQTVNLTLTPVSGSNGNCPTPPPVTGSLKVTKNTTGGDATFSFTGNAGSFQITTASGTGSTTINNLTPGSYTVSETTLAGWTQNSNTCSSVQVVANQTSACIVTNTKNSTPAPGSPTLTKLVRDVTQGQTSFTSSTAANPGDTVEFQMVASANTGDVHNISLTDQLPTKLSYVANSLTVAGASAGNGLTSITLGDLTNNQSKTVILRATVADGSNFSDGTTTLTNTANLTSNNGNATASANVVVTISTPSSNVSLNLTKLVRNLTASQTTFTASANANPGDQVEFQIVTSASGNATANNVAVSDQLPAHLTFVSAQLDSSNTTNQTNFALGNVVPGASHTILITAQVDAASAFDCGNTTITNSANATSDNAGSATGSASVVVNQNTNCGGGGSNVSLTLTKTVRDVTAGQTTFTSSISAVPGDQVEFQIVVSTNGNTTANNVVLTDALPSAITLTSGNLTNNLGNMNAGTSQTILLDGTLASASSFTCGNNTVTNSATATSDNAGNASASATVNVNQDTNCGGGGCTINCGGGGGNPVFINLTKEVSDVSQGTGFNGSVTSNIGDTVQFRLTVRNNSDVTPASDVRVQDVLPPGLSYIPGTFQIDSGTSSGDLFNGGEFLGTMAPASARTILFESLVNSSGTLINNATATADAAQSVNAQATVFVNTGGGGCTINCGGGGGGGFILGGNVNLVLSKKAFNQTQNTDATLVVAHPGDVIDYTLTVQNTGNSPAQNYVFEDNLTNVLQLAQLTNFGNATLNFGALTLTWPAQTISSGTTATETFTVTVNSTFPVGSSNIMSNVFGNTVNINVAKPQVLGAFLAPTTGDTPTLSFILAFLTLFGFVIYRKRELVKGLIYRVNG